MPDEILHCPAGTEAADGIAGIGAGGGGKERKLKLTKKGFLPEPPTDLKAKSKAELRNTFSHCTATRATNQAARDYRRWFCEAKHHD